jgi:two-component system, chemotaxis family, response regulator Rcp1
MAINQSMGIMMTEQRLIQVLIVEDNKADARLVKSFVEETGMPTCITLVGDGEGAIQVMERAANGERPTPDLVLLDINLPNKNGYEVLESIRENDLFLTTFVAMCSGSTSIEDKIRARNNGANAYMVKPMDLEEMNEMVENLRKILALLDKK